MHHRPIYSYAGPRRGACPVGALLCTAYCTVSVLPGRGFVRKVYMVLWPRPTAVVIIVPFPDSFLSGADGSQTVSSSV